MSSGDQLEGLLRPVVEALGYDLVHLEWHGSRPRRLQLFVDRPPTSDAEQTARGFGLDDCARLSPVISNALDAAEVDPDRPEIARILESAYTLEVSSPGLDRPLRRRSDFARFRGHSANVRTFAPLRPDADQRTFSGRITAVASNPDQPDDARAGWVELTAEDGIVHRIDLALVRRANLVFEG